MADENKDGPLPASNPSGFEARQMSVLTGQLLPDEEDMTGNADRDKFSQPSEFTQKVKQEGGEAAEQSSEAGGGAYEEQLRLLQVFEQWLIDAGAKFPQLVMRQYDEEVRGVHATEDIEPEVDIIEIPLRCLITVEMGKDTEVGRAVLHSNLDLDAPKHIYIMLFMLTDRKKPDSFFKPYYDILPATLNNMPIFWSEEEMAWLEGSYLVRQTEERNEAIIRDYHAICGVYPAFSEICDVDEFKWCRMAVCSRNFGGVINGVRTSMMVPHADMLNHFRPRETKWAFDNSKQAFTVTSLQHLPTGKQVYDSYGSKCNHRFLLNYGFSIENNVESDGTCPNECSLAFKVRDDDAHRELKLGFWSRGGGNMERRTRVSIADNENARQAFSFCRVLAANEDEFAQITGANGRGGGAYSFRTPTDIRHPVCKRNELAAMALFETILQEHLDAYPDTLEVDREKLAPGRLEPFSNERHAVIHVAGEKVVIHHFLRLARTAREVFEEDDDERRRERVEALYRAGGADVYIANYVSSCMAQLREHERLEQYVAREQSREGEAGAGGGGDPSIFDAAGNLRAR